MHAAGACGPFADRPWVRARPAAASLFPPPRRPPPSPRPCGRARPAARAPARGGCRRWHRRRRRRPTTAPVVCGARRAAVWGSAHRRHPGAAHVRTAGGRRCQAPPAHAGRDDRARRRSSGPPAPPLRRPGNTLPATAATLTTSRSGSGSASSRALRSTWIERGNRPASSLSPISAARCSANSGFPSAVSMMLAACAGARAGPAWVSSSRVCIVVEPLERDRDRVRARAPARPALRELGPCGADDQQRAVPVAGEQLLDPHPATCRPPSGHPPARSRPFAPAAIAPTSRDTAQAMSGARRPRRRERGTPPPPRHRCRRASDSATDRTSAASALARDLEQRLQRRGARDRAAVARQRGESVSQTGKFGHEPRLADPRLAEHHHQVRPSTLLRPLQRPAKQLELRAASRRSADRVAGGVRRRQDRLPPAARRSAARSSPWPQPARPAGRGRRG